jgi:N-acetylmuramoyl-L-alanine amidase
MRNASDAATMTSPAGRQAIAAQLAAGIRTFLGR